MTHSIGMRLRHRESPYASSLGPVAPSWFSSELDQVGRRELVHEDCALHHFWLNSISLELKFKPEPAISSDQALNSAFLHK